MKTNILGVAFDALTLTEAEERADALLRARRGGYIVTANPEIVLHSRDDAAYAAAVNGADLVLADGVGDLYAARILGTPLPERVAGSDLTPAHAPASPKGRGRLCEAPVPVSVSPVPKMGIFPMKRRFSQRSIKNSRTCCFSVSACRGRNSGWRETGRGRTPS